MAARHLFPAFATACDASAWFLDSVVDLDDQPSSEKLWKLKIHLGVRNSSLNWVAGKRFRSLNTNNAQAVITTNCPFQTVQAQENCFRRVNNSIRVIGRSPHQQSSIQHVHRASTIPAGIVFDRAPGVSDRAGYVGGVLALDCFLVH